MTRIVVNTFLKKFFKAIQNKKQPSVSTLTRVCLSYCKKYKLWIPYKRGNPIAEGIGYRIMRGSQGQALKTIDSIPYFILKV
jgi:hypothetical protein